MGDRKGAGQGHNISFDKCGLSQEVDFLRVELHKIAGNLNLIDDRLTKVLVSVEKNPNPEPKGGNRTELGVALAECDALKEELRVTLETNARLSADLNRMATEKNELGDDCLRYWKERDSIKVELEAARVELRFAMDARRSADPDWGVSTEVDALKNLIGSLKEDRDKVVADLHKTVVELEALKREHDTDRTWVVSAHELVHKAVADLKKTNGQLEAAREGEKSALMERDKVVADLHKMVVEFEALGKDCLQYKRERDALEKDVADLRTELESTHSTYRQRLTSEQEHRAKLLQEMSEIRDIVMNRVSIPHWFHQKKDG